MREDVKADLAERLPEAVRALEVLREVDDLLCDLVRPEIVELLRLAINLLDRSVEREIFEYEREATKQI